MIGPVDDEDANSDGEEPEKAQSTAGEEVDPDEAIVEIEYIEQDGDDQEVREDQSQVGGQQSGSPDSYAGLDSRPRLTRKLMTPRM